jgi:hypothetical protein
MECFCVLGGGKLRYKDCPLTLKPHKISENKPKDTGFATQSRKLKKMYFMTEKD